MIILVINNSLIPYFANTIKKYLSEHEQLSHDELKKSFNNILKMLFLTDLSGKNSKFLHYQAFLSNIGRHFLR